MRSERVKSMVIRQGPSDVCEGLGGSLFGHGVRAYDTFGIGHYVPFGLLGSALGLYARRMLG